MKRTALGAIVVAALLAGFGCSGGGSSVNPVPAPSSAKAETAKATVTIVIPGKAIAAAKKPAYVSTATRSISLTGAGITPQSIDIPSITSCTGPDGNGAYTCTLSFDIPIGAVTLLVKTWDTAGATGNVLSMNTLNTTIVPGVNNNLNLTLNGVVKTLTLTVTPGTSFTAGTPSNFAATWGGKDAAGNTIIGPGSLVDANASLITPTLVASDAAHFSIGTPTNNNWPVAYDGFDDSPTQSLTLAATGYTSVVANLTIVPAATPTPTASPTPTPTASPTPTPTPTPGPVATDAVTNGNFATGDLTGWFNCYANHAGYSAPVSASPSPQPTSAQAAANPTPTPYDVSVQATTATGTPPPSGNTHFALVGAGQSVASTTNEPKGQSGICQTVAVPASAATLSFELFEGGNDSFTNSDAEADVYSSSAWASTTDGTITTATPTATLMAEDNCYDNLQNNKLYFSTPWGSGTHAPTTTARYAWCPYTPGGTTIGGTVSQGGYWYTRSFDMSAYAGTNVTLFFGIWRSAGGGTGTSSSPSYYNYAYFSNIHLNGTNP